MTNVINLDQRRADNFATSTVEAALSNDLPEFTTKALEMAVSAFFSPIALAVCNDTRESVKASQVFRACKHVQANYDLTENGLKLVLDGDYYYYFERLEKPAFWDQVVRALEAEEKLNIAKQRYSIAKLRASL